MSQNQRLDGFDAHNDAAHHFIRIDEAAQKELLEIYKKLRDDTRRQAGMRGAGVPQDSAAFKALQKKIDEADEEFKTLEKFHFGRVRGLKEMMDWLEANTRPR